MAAPHTPTGPARAALAAARRRYHRMRPTERPPLDQQANACTLFTAEELVELARCSYWPLSAEAQVWVAEPPSERARLRRRLNRRIARVVREVVAAELPEAVAYLLQQWRATG